MASEVLYPIPKNCVVCREKFYVGMKIKKTSNNITRYYNTNEKERIINRFENELYQKEMQRKIESENFALKIKMLQDKSDHF